MLLLTSLEYFKHLHVLLLCTSYPLVFSQLASASASCMHAMLYRIYIRTRLQPFKNSTQIAFGTYSLFIIHSNGMVFYKGDGHIWGVFLPRAQWALTLILGPKNMHIHDLGSKWSHFRRSNTLLIYQRFILWKPFHKKSKLTAEYPGSCSLFTVTLWISPVFLQEAITILRHHRSIIDGPRVFGLSISDHERIP